MFEAQSMKVVNGEDWLAYLRMGRPGFCCGTTGGFEICGFGCFLCIFNSQLRTGADKGNPTS